MTEVLAAIRERRSCRGFLDAAVSKSTVEAIIETARWAPSGGNLQPWRVIAVSGEARDAVVRVAGEALFSGADEEGEHAIYPPSLWEPYRSRRFANAESLYASLGVAREDKAARYRWVAENFRFFGAPVGLFFVIDRRMGHGQWAHLGMFMMAVALAAEAHGLGTCMQEAWAKVRGTLHGHLGLGADELLYCGMALGWPDLSHPSVAMVRERAPVEEIADFRGFAPDGGGRDGLRQGAAPRKERGMTDHPSLAEVVSSITGEPLGLDAPPSWSQGRTLYGGMTAALGWAAAVRTSPDLPPLRSVHAAFVGPAAGKLELQPTILRQGKSATTVGVDVRGDAGLAARLTFFCGAARASKVAHERVARPAAPNPAELPAVLSAGQGPTFAANYDIRHVSGGLPFSGGEPEFVMWARMRDAGGADPLVSLIALADVLPPASMPVFPEPAVISSLSWSFDLDRLPEDAGAWYLCRATAESTADGYSRQAMDLWDAHGRRVLSGRQTVAIFI